MIYLAVPYSHPDPWVREARFEAANRLAAQLIEAGQLVFSPISMSHPIEQHMSEVRSTDFWLRLDMAIAPHCTRLVILKMPGWKESRGVDAEIAYFADRGLPITYLYPGEAIPWNLVSNAA